MRSPSSVVLAIALLAAAACAQDVNAIAAAAKTLQTAPCLAGGRVGIVVADLADGRTLYRARDDEGFLPASNMKLISAAVALKTLGPDFTFVTKLETSGEVVESELRGDLVLVGDGDPSLGGRSEASPYERLDGLVQALIASGVRKVKGRIIGLDDCQCDESRGSGWAWDYLSEDYAAPFGGLCFHDNIAIVRVKGGELGKPAVVHITPEVGALRVQNEVVCGAPDTKTALQLERPLGSGTAILRGTLAAGHDEEVLKVSIENPTRYAAAGLRTALGLKDVAVSGPAVDADEVGGAGGLRRELARSTSPALRELLVPVMKHSINLGAEQLLRTASRKAGSDGSTVAAEKHAKAVLTQMGVDVHGLVIADGSGLSRRDLVQPRQLAQLLLAMGNDPLRAVFEGSLPVGGVDGTLAKRFVEGPAKGRVRAKTGFVSRVACLSGYLQRADAKAPPLVFVVMLNDFPCDTDEAKAAIDAFVTALAQILN